MLSPNKHCEMLSADARHRSTAMIDGFKLSDGRPGCQGSLELLPRLCTRR